MILQMILPLFIGTLGVPELGIILLICVFLFGGKKIPQIAKGLADSIWSFKGAMKEGKEAAQTIKTDLEEATGEINEALSDKPLTGGPREL